MSLAPVNSSDRAPRGPKLNFKGKKNWIICHLTSVKRVKTNTIGKISTSKNPSETPSIKPKCSGATYSISLRTTSPSPSTPCSPGSAKTSWAAAESHHYFIHQFIIIKWGITSPSPIRPPSTWPVSISKPSCQGEWPPKNPRNARAAKNPSKRNSHLGLEGRSKQTSRSSAARSSLISGWCTSTPGCRLWSQSCTPSTWSPASTNTAPTPRGARSSSPSGSPATGSCAASWRSTAIKTKSPASSPWGASPTSSCWSETPFLYTSQAASRADIPNLRIFLTSLSSSRTSK